MYAVIRSGGKQEKVSVGQSVRLELLDGLIGDTIDFAPLLVVDQDDVISGTSAATAIVKGEIIRMDKGPKIKGFKYRPKSNNRRRFGHRQRYAIVKVLEILK